MLARTSPGNRSVVMLGDVPEPVGGVGEVCVQVCAELAARSVDVHFIDTEPHPRKRPPPLATYQVARTREARTVAALAGSAPLLLRCSPELRALVLGRGVRRAVPVLNLAARAATLVRRSGAGLVFAHHAGSRGLAASVVKEALGVRTTVMAHGSEVAHPGWQSHQQVTRFVLEHADHVITPSAYTRDLCTGVATPHRIDVVPNGVDHRRFHAGVRSHPAGAGDPLTVLFVGHLHPRKGPAVLAEAIPGVTGARPIRVVFAGPDHGEAERIRQIVAAAGVTDRVHLPGMVPFEDLPALYGSADVVVFPTVWGTEGFGLVAAEAMACGTPVVASRVGAIPEVVEDGVTGQLVAPGDSESLAATLSELLGDPPRLRVLGHAAAAHAAGFRWSNLADAVVEDL